ncbi:zf-HC2 domain-containing protein [Saccharopolyspora karakumensis]|uniref:Zf-HC2 domain-containing protein n=1 Tax=Saccharopolyspora karakumensis TaxID=2530386 RepID=A0A4R5BEF9_9PSEU|nr:zf-HC2 domain-containing protein [Saccharopolyspora karakumensis]TDD83985.1 zf-HC2 domain-containing protein [Saccharopolyspora karakumensis]
MSAWFQPLRRDHRSQQWAQRAKDERTRQCVEALSLLQRYIDRDLAPSELEEFERHLDSCRGCEAETRLYLDIKRSLAERKGFVDRAASSRLRQFAMGLRDWD